MSSKWSISSIRSKPRARSSITRSTRTHRGGHAFNRLDTRLARESRAEIYRFLAGYLHPEKPAK